MRYTRDHDELSYTDRARAYLRHIENYDDGLIPVGLLEMLWTEYGDARLKRQEVSKEVCINLLKDLADERISTRK